MVDKYDSETLVKIYRMLNKKCQAIDGYIKNHALNFSISSVEFSSADVCDSIINLMTKKNQLINLKLIVDSAVNKLSEDDKKIIYLKMHYSLSIEEICAVLHLKERTAFRHIEHAMQSLADMLNRSKYLDKLISIMNNEVWIVRLKQEIKTRRLNYHTAQGGLIN